MRINYTRGGLEESEMAQWQDDPMRAWAEWFKQATEQKVRGAGVDELGVGELGGCREWECM